MFELITCALFQILSIAGTPGATQPAQNPIVVANGGGGGWGNGVVANGGGGGWGNGVVANGGGGGWGNGVTSK